MARRIHYVVTEDWYFLSHRLPMARAAKAAGYEVHVATRLKDGKAAIEQEAFFRHALAWSRGSLSAAGSFTAIMALRRLINELRPDILHNVSLKPVLLGTVASLGLSATAVVNSVTGLGTLFIGEAKVSEQARKAPATTRSQMIPSIAPHTVYWGSRSRIPAHAKSLVTGRTFTNAKPPALISSRDLSRIPRTSSISLRFGFITVTSVYSKKLGEEVASPLITVVDDPTLPQKRGSYAFDDEGVPSRRTVLVEKGILKSYLYDRLTVWKKGLNRAEMEGESPTNKSPFPG